MLQEISIKFKLPNSGYQINISEIYKVTDKLIVILEFGSDGPGIGIAKETDVLVKKTIDIMGADQLLPVSYYLVGGEKQKYKYASESLLCVESRHQILLPSQAVCLYSSTSDVSQREALFSRSSSVLVDKSRYQPMGSASHHLSRALQVAKLIGTDLDALENVIRVAKEYDGASRAYVIGMKSAKHPEIIYYPVQFHDSVEKGKVGMSNLLRGVYGVTLTDSVNACLLIKNEEYQAIESLSCEIVGVKGTSSPTNRIRQEVLLGILMSRLQDYPLVPGQYLFMAYADKEVNVTLELKITAINGQAPQDQGTSPVFYKLNESPELKITVSPLVKKVHVTGIAPLPSISLNFAVKGVGGHKKQLESLLRDVFFSRAMPTEYAEQYGVHHTKGILLYGPPGTGKTLIGRVIGSMLTTEDRIKVVNGPELKNKFVGQGAQNLRDVFQQADDEWAAKGPESGTHVIIFDEIDALCPERGSRSGGTGSDEDMVSTLLTKLDGIKQQHNFVVIGTTNRLDLIDPALKRPGRLECHLQIGLPDEKDRLEILQIKIADMKKNNLVDDSVDLTSWAVKTKNYTGAELEELVRKAVHYAMGANFTLEPSDGSLSIRKDIKDKSKLEKVAQEHFRKAFAEIQPAFGTDKQFNKFKKESFIFCSEQMSTLVENFRQAVSLLKSRRDLTSYQLLLSGSSGSGKTSLALYLAEQSEASYVKVITAEKLLSLPLNKQLDYIDEQFSNASRVELSVLILDDIESLIGADAELQGYNNTLRLKLQSCLKALEHSEHRCIVIATTQNLKFISRIKLADTFSEKGSLGNIVLQYRKLAECQEMIKKIGRSLDYDIRAFLPITQNVDDPRIVEMPIRDLLYQIKKYMFQNANKSRFDFDDFYRFINPDQDLGRIYSLRSSPSSPHLFQSVLEEGDKDTLKVEAVTTGFDH